jgi:hypothetical protein
MVLAKNLRGAGALHKGLFNLARAEKRDVVVMMASWFWASKYNFILNFYIPTSAVFSLIIKKLNKSMPDGLLFDSKRWHMMWIDSDDL